MSFYSHTLIPQDVRPYEAKLAAWFGPYVSKNLAFTIIPSQFKITKDKILYFDKKILFWQLHLSFFIITIFKIRTLRGYLFGGGVSLDLNNYSRKTFNTSLNNPISLLSIFRFFYSIFLKNIGHIFIYLFSGSYTIYFYHYNARWMLQCLMSSLNQHLSSYLVIRCVDVKK